MARIVARAPGQLLGALVSASLALAAAPCALACGSSGYTYAGVTSTSRTYGVGALLTAIDAPLVQGSGHVAGWVGVGAPPEGPDGRGEGIQVGFSGFRGSAGSDLYYEVIRAGAAPHYVQVESDLPAGTSRQLAVLEIGNRPNWWRVWVDGSPVSNAIDLPGSHGAWQGTATAESWSNAPSAGCNGFDYRFDHIVIAQHAGGAWRSLSDAVPIRTGGNRLLRPSASSFQAIS